MSYEQDGTFTTIHSLPTPKEILEWLTTGDWFPLCPWKVNLTASILFALKDNMITASSDNWSKLFSPTPEQRRQLLDHCFDIVQDAATDFCLHQNSPEDPATGLKRPPLLNQEVCKSVTLITQGTGSPDDPVVPPARSWEFLSRVARSELIQAGNSPSSCPQSDEGSLTGTVGIRMPRQAKYPNQAEAIEARERIAMGFHHFAQETGESLQDTAGPWRLC